MGSKPTPSKDDMQFGWVHDHPKTPDKICRHCSADNFVVPPSDVIVCPTCDCVAIWPITKPGGGSVAL